MSSALHTITKQTETMRLSALSDLADVERSCRDHRERLERGEEPFGPHNLGARVGEYLVRVGKFTSLMETRNTLEEMRQDNA